MTNDLVIDRMTIIVVKREKRELTNRMVERKNPQASSLSCRKILSGSLDSREKERTKGQCKEKLSIVHREKINKNPKITGTEAQLPLRVV